MEEFSKCFTDEKNSYKQKELLALAELIKENEQPDTTDTTDTEE
jgi:hypothetical protein